MAMRGSTSNFTYISFLDQRAAIYLGRLGGEKRGWKLHYGVSIH